MLGYSPKSAAKDLSAEDKRGPSGPQDTPAHVDKVPSPGMSYNPKAAAKALKAEDSKSPC